MRCLYDARLCRQAISPYAEHRRAFRSIDIRDAHLRQNISRWLRPISLRARRLYARLSPRRRFTRPHVTNTGLSISIARQRFITYGHFDYETTPDAYDAVKARHRKRLPKPAGRYSRRCFVPPPLAGSDCPSMIDGSLSAVAARDAWLASRRRRILLRFMPH